MLLTKSLRLPKDLNTRMKVAALRRDASRNAVLTKIITDYAIGTPNPAQEEEPRTTDAYKVFIDGDIWEAAKGRAVIEGKSLAQAIREQAERDLAE